MQVLKFGGTSVANVDNINKVVAIVKEKLKKDLSDRQTGFQPVESTSKMLVGRDRLEV